MVKGQSKNLATSAVHTFVPTYIGFDQLLWRDTDTQMDVTKK